VVKGLRRGSWEMIQDSSLGVYFYNYRTSDSQWEAPDCFAEDVRCCGYATARIPPPTHTTRLRVDEGKCPFATWVCPCVPAD
jgi:hypothetical protein